MRTLLLAAALLLVTASSALAGPRPGPPLLYEPAPRVPQLEVRAPFAAAPLLVSGTDAYRNGEYLYQDYLYDDHGAETGATVSKPGVSGFSPASGDLAYPATGRRHANNAADIIELRIRPTRGAVVYRVTLGAVIDRDATVVGLGIDTDGRGGLIAWPHGAGVSSAGVDRFITAWGTGGDLTRLPGGGSAKLPAGAVRMNRRTNQMTIRVPRRLMDPGRATWRYVAGAGLWSGSGFRRPDPDVPGVFNLAFRFDERQPRGSGTWFEAGQAAALADGTTGSFRADVDFARLAARANRWIHRPGLKQARIYPSRLKLHEGVREEFPQFGGPLQPYLVFVPGTYPRLRRAGITWALHSLSATYTQYAVFSPNQPRQLGAEHGRLYVTPLGRGPDGWYTDEAEVDFFEVWADLARHFRVDPSLVALSGYSMGGYGTYKLGFQWPDLFGAAFTTVGPPVAGGYLNTIQLVENARWVPYLNWAGRTDASVPIGLVRAQQARFEQLGLRSRLWTYPGGHYDLAAGDRWDGARSFLAGPVVQRDPRRVDYAFVPSADNHRLGLVHDHAYWVSGLRARANARAQIKAVSSAPTRRFTQGGNPVVQRADTWDGNEPRPESVTGTAWDGVAQLPAANRLQVELDNVRRAQLDGRRAGLTGRRCLRLTIASDGPASVVLALRLPAGARARRGDSCSAGARAPEVRLTRRGAALGVAAGTQSWVILPE